MLAKAFDGTSQWLGVVVAIRQNARPAGQIRRRVGEIDPEDPTLFIPDTSFDGLFEDLQGAVTRAKPPPERCQRLTRRLLPLLPSGCRD